MTSKELSKLIREFVKAEIKNQKAEIIKEVKAELFDAMVSAPTPTVQNESVAQPTSADMTRSQLRGMFAQNLGMDTVNFNTNNVDVMPSTHIPKTFEGGSLKQEHQDTLNAINKDYSGLMKKMGI
jgi:hypothetical protein